MGGVGISLIPLFLLLFNPPISQTSIPNVQFEPRISISLDQNHPFVIPPSRTSKKKRLHGRHYALRSRSGFTLTRKRKPKRVRPPRIPVPCTRSYRKRRSKHKHRVRPPRPRPRARPPRPPRCSRTRKWAGRPKRTPPPTPVSPAPPVYGPHYEFDYADFFDNVCNMERSYLTPSEMLEFQKFYGFTSAEVDEFLSQGIDPLHWFRSELSLSRTTCQD